MTESGKYNVHTDKALYEGKGSGCFLLRCNISELHPDDMAAQSGVQDDVSIAYGVLLEYGEVQDYINSGMSVQYTGETEVIEGKPCMVFALGTDRDDQFVRERYYAVCDNLVYSYDAEGDA